MHGRCYFQACREDFENFPVQPQRKAGDFSGDSGHVRRIDRVLRGFRGRNRACQRCSENFQGSQGKRCFFVSKIDVTLGKKLFFHRSQGKRCFFHRKLMFTPPFFPENSCFSRLQSEVHQRRRIRDR